MAGVKLIAGGAWVRVYVTETSGGTAKQMGLASQVSYDEDWSLQPCNVIGKHGPISIDSQGYSCTINIGTFVAETAPSSAAHSADGGEISLKDLIPNRSDVQTNGKGRTFANMQFINMSSSEIIASFNDVIVASNGASVTPNAYVTANMRFQTLERVKNPTAAAPA
jgi:hypothetical protein